MLSCKIGKHTVLEIQVLGVLQMPKGSLIGYSIVNHSPRVVDWFSIKFRLHTDKGDIDHWVAGADLPPNGTKTNIIYSDGAINEVREISILQFLSSEELL